MKYYYIDEFTNEDNLANLDLYVVAKNYEYGDNQSANMGNKIVYIEDSLGYRMYSEYGYFDLNKMVDEYFNYELEKLSEKEKDTLWEILDTISEKISIDK